MFLFNPVPIRLKGLSPLFPFCFSSLILYIYIINVYLVIFIRYEILIKFLSIIYNINETDFSIDFITEIEQNNRSVSFYDMKIRLDQYISPEKTLGKTLGKL